MSDVILILNGNEFHDRFRGDDQDFPGFHYTKWRNIERFFHEDHWDAKARYMCYIQDGILLGVNKFYLRTVAERMNNKWRESQGLAPAKGKWFGHAFIDVRQDAQKQGIAAKLFDKMLSMMNPGDVYSSDMYSDTGRAFIAAWVKSRRGKINLITTPYDYDPDRINFSLGDDLKLNQMLRVAARYLSRLRA